MFPIEINVAADQGRRSRSFHVWLWLALLLVCARPGLGADETSSLAIVDAGVQDSEEAPFVNTDYQFLPGDYLYVTIHIAGYTFKLNEEQDVRAIHLNYSMQPVDLQGVPLTAPQSGDISENLTSENKNWVPVKRAMFLLPSFLLGGAYQVQVKVTDELAHKDATRYLPFTVGGPRFDPVDGLSVQRFQFLRKEDARQAMELPAYAPGDVVFCSFDLVGFQLRAGNEYDLSYGVTVLRPDGKPFIETPDAAYLKSASFYPARYLPANLNVLTKKQNPKGAYILIVTARDRVSGKTATLKESFTLE